MSIIDAPFWPELRKHIRLEAYDRDGGHENPRHRINVKLPADIKTTEELLAVTWPCAACGDAIKPVRLSSGWSSYLAVTCRLEKNLACARNPAAHHEYERIIADVGDLPSGLPLFD